MRQTILPREMTGGDDTMPTITDPITLASLTAGLGLAFGWVIRAFILGKQAGILINRGHS